MLGFLISVHSRFEPELNAGFTSMSQSLSGLANDNELSPLTKPLPLGDHKDQHGYYHTHAPFMAPVVDFICHFSFALFTPEAVRQALSTSSRDIHHPPRT